MFTQKQTAGRASLSCLPAIAVLLSMPFMLSGCDNATNRSKETKTTTKETPTGTTKTTETKEKKVETTNK